MPDKEMLSKNFFVKEMSCKCGCEKGKYPQTGIVILLELIRAHFGHKYDANCIVDVRGGNRCLKHNEKIQKKYYPLNHNGKPYIPFSSKSTHMEFGAADIRVFVRTRNNSGDIIDWAWTQISPKEIYDFLDELFLNSLGLGLYKTFNHIDISSKKRRWNNA